MMGIMLFFLLPGCRAETILMRVVARDNTKEGQEEKLRVRNAALAFRPRRREDLPLSLLLMEKIAGQESDCRVSLRPWMPPGEKTPRLTVYITIGQGEGKNWFGVLFEEALLLTAEETPGDEQTLCFPWLSRIAALFTGAPAGSAGWSDGSEAGCGCPSQRMSRPGSCFHRSPDRCITP